MPNYQFTYREGEMLYQVNYKADNKEHALTLFRHDYNDQLYESFQEIPDPPKPTETELRKDETTFKMFVHPTHKQHLVNAIHKVRDEKEISFRSGLKVHEVSYAILKTEKPDEVWFRIVVSRPFLIFRIGEVYNMFKYNATTEFL